jgi:hypothetical protein
MRTPARGTMSAISWSKVETWETLALRCSNAGQHSYTRLLAKPVFHHRASPGRLIKKTGESATLFRAPTACWVLACFQIE